MSYGYNPQLVRVVDPLFSPGPLLQSDDTFASDRRTVVIITATVTINYLKVSAGLMLTKHICSRLKKKEEGFSLYEYVLCWQYK